jgi:membrane protease YdiL (CAAX protease family)
MKARALGHVPTDEGTIAPSSVDAPIRHYHSDIRRSLLLAPVVLIATMYVVFQVAARLGGVQVAHYAGFAIYWLVWGVGAPLFVVGRHGVADVLLSRDPERHRLPWRAAILLAGPPIVAFAFVFPALFPSPRDAMLIALAAYALANGVLEEVFWRGVYARVFPLEMGRGLIYPAAMYGAWLLVPMSLYPSTLSDAIAVYCVGFAMGLLYGWVAWRTGSIRWTILSHVLTNLGGVGALVLFRY